MTGEPMNEIPPGNDNRPKSWAQLGIGAQFGIALSLVAVGLLSSWLGLDAGLGSSFRDSIISSLVGDGQIFFNGGILLAGAGVIWALVCLVRCFLA